MRTSVVTIVGFQIGDLRFQIEVLCQSSSVLKSAISILQSEVAAMTPDLDGRSVRRDDIMLAGSPD
jgi:hypothetical protein